MKTATIAVILAAWISPSYAQDASETFVTEPRCWIGGLSFSPGLTIRASNKVMVCEAGGSWSPTDAAAAGCIWEGKFSSTGTLEGVSNNKAVSIECEADGTWKVVRNAAP